MLSKKFVFVLVSIFFFILIMQNVKATILTNCEDTAISTPGYYELDRNVTSADTCFTIATSNVEIDCKGYKINYADTGNATRFGINVFLGVTPLTNVTIRNCILEKPSNLNTAGYGIYLQRTSNSFIINNTIRTNGTTNNYGIYFFTSCNNNLIENNTIQAYGTSTGNVGIYLNTEVRNNIIKNNIVSGIGTTTSYAFYSSYGRDNIIENNNFSTNSSATTSNGHVIYLASSSERNILRNNYIYGNGRDTSYNVYLTGNSNFNNIINNTIIAIGTGASNMGIYAVGSDDNLIENNTISTNGGGSTNYGVYLQNSAEANVVNNNKISTYGGGSTNYGIYLYTVLSNNITNNNISTNGASTANVGIQITSSPKNYILNNTISTNGTTIAYGIGFSGSNMNYMRYNTISTNCPTAGVVATNAYGFYATGSDWNEFTNNNISTIGSRGNSGIYITSSTNNLFQDNFISAYGSNTLNSGIFFYSSSNYNTVFNNTISTYGTTTNHGIYVYSANRNNITSNKISTNGSSTTNYGVFITTGSDRNIVAYNNISTYGTTTNSGVNVVNGNGNKVFENYIVANGSTQTTAQTYNYGVSLSATSYINEVYNNTIYTGGGRGNFGVYLLTDSERNSITQNNLNTGGMGTENYGVCVIASHNNTIEENTISTSGTTTNHGVYFASSSRDNLLNNNTISTSGGTDSNGIHFLVIAPNYPENNIIKNNNLISIAGNDLKFATASINGTQLVNQIIRDYSFTETAGSLIIENTSAGKVSFNAELLSGTNTTFSNRIYITQNLAFIDEYTALLNQSAEITFYNVSTIRTNLGVYRNGVLCPASICLNLTSLNAGNVTFNVTGGGSYSINSSDEIPQVITLLSPENNTNITGQDYSFNFSVTDETSNLFKCYLYIDDILYGSNESVLDSIETNISASGISGGNHQWYISCLDESNWDQSSEIRTIQNLIPSVVYNSPENNSYVNNANSVLLNLTLSDTENSFFTVYVYGDDVLINESSSVSNGEFTYNWTGLSLGEHNWSVIANDGLSNSTEPIYYFNIINLTINCEAGGPYQSGALILVQGNVSDGTFVLQNQNISLNIYDSLNSLITDKNITSDSSGNFQTSFSGLSAGNLTLNSSVSYNGIDVSCIDTLAVGGGAVIQLDKIISLHNITNTSIIYNVSLKSSNLGSSSLNNGYIVDSDSAGSPYPLGTIGSASSSLVSYIKEYKRNSTTYNSTLAIATANGTDSYSGNDLSANSSQIILIIPASDIDQKLTLIKNAYFNSENSTSVNYTLSIEIVNSGGGDLTGITVLDSDLDVNELMNLNISQSWNYTNSLIIDKEASNSERTFAKSSATVNTITYQSNRININIPGYGGPADTYVYAPDSVEASTSFSSIIEIKNINPDVGQNFVVDYWITNEAETVNYSSGQSTTYVPASGSTNIIVDLTSPSSAGNYRLRALTSYIGGPDTAFDSFIVTSSTPETPQGGEGSGGGGGSITRKTIYEIKDKEIEEGITKQLKDGEKVKFNIIQESIVYNHSLEIINLQLDMATIRIYSLPITILLYVSEEKKLDLNEDGFYDLYIKLDKIEKNKAYIYLKSSYEEFEIEEPKLPYEEKETEEEFLPEKPEWTLNIWRYILKNKIYFIYGGGAIFGLMFMLILIKLIKIMMGKRKNEKKMRDNDKYKSKIKKSLKKIKGRTFLMILAGGILIGILFIRENSMTGFVVGSANLINNNWSIFGFILIIGMLGLLAFIYRKKIAEKIEIKRINKHPKNSLKGLMRKKVYSEEGIFIGKIDEVTLGKNKIDSLQIRLDRKQKFKIKGIIVKYNNVKNIGHIVLIEKKILEKLTI
ncbi:MAG: right-handed parallel beta-helix repeat-containing protein [Candidatus Pacearchaeota archaeon]